MRSTPKKRDIWTEKWESGMALEKRDFPPESGNVDTYVPFSLHLYPLTVDQPSPFFPSILARREFYSLVRYCIIIIIIAFGGQYCC